MKTYEKMLEWLYLNDKEFSSGKEWRTAFLKELKNLLEGEREPIQIIDASPEATRKEFLKVLETAVEDVKPKKEFKVGDKVKVVDLEYRDGDGSIDKDDEEYLNAVGKIEKIDDNDDDYPYDVKFEGLEANYFESNQLELVEEEDVKYNLNTGEEHRRKGKEIIIKGNK